MGSVLPFFGGGLGFQKYLNSALTKLNLNFFFPPLQTPGHTPGHTPSNSRWDETPGRPKGSETPGATPSSRMWDPTPSHTPAGAATPGRDTPGHATPGHGGATSSVRKNRWDETPKTERGS